MTTLAPLSLEGTHVRLEPLAASHASALLPAALDPELWRWTATEVLSLPDLERYIASALRDQRSGTALPFVTRDRASGRAIGSTRLANYDAANRRVEIGWTWIAREFQRTAVNTEAKLLMLEHAFDTLDCIRVELKTDVLNERSRAAIRRIGAVEEGVLRHHVICSTGRVRDTVYYSILAGEWPAVRERLERRLAAG